MYTVHAFHLFRPYICSLLIYSHNFQKHLEITHNFHTQSTIRSSGTQERTKLTSV